MIIDSKTRCILRVRTLISEGWLIDSISYSKCHDYGVDWINEWIFIQTLRGPFFALSKPNFATRHSFCSIFRDLQDWHTFAPLRSQNFDLKSVTIFARMKIFNESWIFFSRFPSDFFYLILQKFGENVMENCPDFAGMSKRMMNFWQICVKIVKQFPD